MQQPSSRCTQSRIHALTQFIVAEVIGLFPLFAYNTALPQFFQPMYQSVLISIAYVQEQTEGELPSDDSSEIRYLSGCRREVSQSGGNHCLDRWGEEGSLRARSPFT